MWGGVECTVHRVGDLYRDQLHLSGHEGRAEDLDRFAALGIRAIRYPVLWERTAPDGLDRADWRWPDERLGRLRELGVRPIVGLVHHGSGPRHTSLVDPSFGDGLAAYAGAVATRYPWVEEWTPVNEPLTTARFSGLYGHWYPHGRDNLTFARALLTQCRAVGLAMRAIRAVNPAARLVQTDDLGKTFATPALAYQAEFENERRWVTWDLLSGRLTPDRPMWRWFRRVGVPESDLAWFLHHPCPPDVVGVNTYLSSERFLDERVDRYPGETPGTNGRHTYVDVLASRVLAEGAAGPESLLREAGERYRLPLAVTEAHNGCTREEQLRWLDEVWRAAAGARAAGADVRAVTVWSLLGAYDWDSLLTRADDHYEPGVFDLRAPSPRPTAIARMVRDLATRGRHDHPVLAAPGWWLRPERLLFYAAVAPSEARQTLSAGSAAPPPPILVVGDGDGVAAAFARHCETRGIPCHLLKPSGAASDPAEIVVAAYGPWAVIDTRDPLRQTEQSDARDAASWAAACARRAIPFLVLSADRVFAGDATAPYVEGDLVVPRDDAGTALVGREVGICAAHPGALIARTGPLFGDGDAQDPLAVALRALAAGEPPPPTATAVVSPTYVPDLVEAALDLLIDGEQGLWHLANAGACRWSDLLRDVAALVGLVPSLVPTVVAGSPAAMVNRALGSERGWPMPPLADALARYARSEGRDVVAAAMAVQAAASSSDAPFDIACWTDDGGVREAS